LGAVLVWSDDIAASNNRFDLSNNCEMLLVL